MGKNLQLSIYILSLFYLSFSFYSCNPENSFSNELNAHDDHSIGKTIDESLLSYYSNNNSFLDTNNFKPAYSYLNGISNRITNAQNLTQYSPTTEKYPVNLRIIHEPGISTAFIVPGGYIYLTKELLTDLHNEAQLTAIMSLLTSGNQHRITIKKLSDRFSISFLIDLALGGQININHSLLINELKNVPYDTTDVNRLNISTEKIICELGYNIRSYSDIFIQNQTKDMEWHQLFPRNNVHNYASHLHNDVKFSPECINSNYEGLETYNNFKLLID